MLVSFLLGAVIDAGTRSLVSTGLSDAGFGLLVVFLERARFRAK